MDVTEDTIQQETELDEVDIPNLPIKEAERRAGWKSLPQKVRIAIRRLHRQFGHVPQKVLLNLLRSARVSKQYIDAVKYFRCVECEENAPRRTGHKTSLPNRYEFNYALGIDVLEILDADGAKYQVLNMICLGHVSSLLRSSELALDSLRRPGVLKQSRSVGFLGLGTPAPYSVTAAYIIEAFWHSI